MLTECKTKPVENKLQQLTFVLFTLLRSDLTPNAHIRHKYSKPIKTIQPQVITDVSLQTAS